MAGWLGEEVSQREFEVLWLLGRPQSQEGGAGSVGMSWQRVAASFRGLAVPCHVMVCHHPRLEALGGQHDTSTGSDAD